MAMYRFVLQVFSSFIDEESFRADLSLVEGPHRSLEPSSYEGIRAWGSLFGYQEAGLDLSASPAYLKSQYASVQGDSYPDDMYAFETAAKRTKHLINPADMQSRSDSAKYQSGIYVPQGSILPLGDNRDNSRDGRYFGPVTQKKINGSVRFRFWPFTSMKYLGGCIVLTSKAPSPIRRISISLFVPLVAPTAPFTVNLRLLGEDPRKTMFHVLNKRLLQ